MAWSACFTSFSATVGSRVSSGASATAAAVSRVGSRGGILGFFQKKKNDIQSLKAQYSKAETNVNKVVETLEGHQVTLMKDVADGDHPGELQVVELLFKAVAHIGQVVVGLGVLLV